MHIHKSYLSLVSIFLATPLLGSCGATSSSSTASTPTIAAEALSDATDSIADDSSTSSTFLAAQIKPQTSSNTLTVTRQCAGGGSNGTPVTVEGTYTGSQTITVTRPKISLDISFTESGTISRVWTPPALQTINCNLAQNHVQIPWETSAVVNGLSVTQTVDRERNASRTITVTATGKTYTKTYNFTATGSRTVTWAMGDGVSGASVTREKTITSDITRVATITNAAGTNESFSGNVKVTSDAPLVVDVVRDSTAPYALQTKTIKSGTVIATRTGKDRVESAFTNVVYDFSSDTPCLPTSGTIAVSYFSTATGTTASKTYTITFGATTDSGVSITEAGGTEEDFPEYNPKGCELEKEI